ncbi:hypothetical protein QR680_008306 [Steinernema hermaphroditum]|uniref:Uncharacterized protein n=1 Tax=Steinernema hermaphroditum TaxID=289476 RepID=A0AA39IG69_9BILA|nr:hypothetical protein QR680_008306 [Steinernema hermaphroditum]
MKKKSEKNPNEYATFTGSSRTDYRSLHDSPSDRRILVVYRVPTTLPLLSLVFRLRRFAAENYSKELEYPRKWPRMPPPAFLPSLASELKKQKLVKKKVIDKTASVDSITATTKPNCSFAEKAKGTADAGYCSVVDRESPSSTEQNNNDSPKSASPPQEKRKHSSGSISKPAKVKSEKKKSKKGFTISSLYQAAKKEEAKPPPTADLPVVDNQGNEEEQLPATPVESVPDAWDEGIETPRSCPSPVKLGHDEEVYVEVDEVFPPEIDRKEVAYGYGEVLNGLPIAPRPNCDFVPQASTSSVGCFGCNVPIAPFSDDIWKYTPPHRADCSRRPDAEINGNTKAESPYFYSHRMKQRERLRLIREEMERHIPSDPWKDTTDDRLYNWCSEVNCKSLDSD